MWLADPLTSECFPDLRHRPCNNCHSLNERCEIQTSGGGATFDCVRCKMSRIKCSFSKDFDDLANPAKAREPFPVISSPQDIKNLGLSWSNGLLLDQILTLENRLTEVEVGLGRKLDKIARSLIDNSRGSSPTL